MTEVSEVKQALQQSYTGWNLLRPVEKGVVAA